MKTEILSKEDSKFFDRCIQFSLVAYPREKVEPPKSNIIYHYCTIDTLIPLLEYSNIWASNYKFMNDKNEGSYLMRLLDHVSNVETKKDLKFLESKITDVYISSFSENGDDLYQWQLYADGGKGVAIGFNIQTFDTGHDGYPIDLRERFEVEKPRFGIVKVIYDKNKQVEMLEKLISGFNQLRNEVQNPIQEKLFKKFFYRGFTMLSCRCKDKAWEKENEWRIIGLFENVNTDIYDPELFNYQIQGEQDKLFFRVTKDNRLAPYYKVPFNPGQDIKEIRFGPKNNSSFEDLEYSLKMYFKTRNLKIPSIKKSSIELAF